MTHIDKPSDLWETPQWLFDELNKEFEFHVDLCANKDNSKCEFYCEDYLQPRWPSLLRGKDPGHLMLIGFMNPPYSAPYNFVQKAFNDIAQNSCLLAVVCLLKCDPSTKTWAVFWDYEKQQPKPGVEIRYLPKRLKFERDGVAGQSAPFPSVIVIMRGQCND